MTCGAANRTVTTAHQLLSWARRCSPPPPPALTNRKGARGRPPPPHAQRTTPSLPATHERDLANPVAELRNDQIARPVDDQASGAVQAGCPSRPVRETLDTST